MNGKSHAGAARAGRWLQSRRDEGGKRGSATLAAVAAILVPTFCAATWQHRVTVGILSASALLWLVPVRPRWWAARDSEEALPVVQRTATDLALIAGTWVLATWALWQHRVLPLVVCAVAATLALLDVAARPELPLPTCVPQRTPRGRAVPADLDA